MSNDTTWLTAADAARVLRVSARQVHRYAETGQLVTRRAGRRVLFDAASVARLADDLAVDIRPAAQTRDLMPPEMVRYLQEQGDMMRQQGETQATIDRRLAAIEAQIQQPLQTTLPRWLPIVAGIIIVLLFVILVILLWRGL